MTYQNKYLKYKSKYLNQTKNYYLNGGGPSVPGAILRHLKDAVGSITPKPYNIEEERTKLIKQVMDEKQEKNVNYNKIFDCVDPKLTDDKETVFKLLDISPHLLFFASEGLKDNKEIVLYAVKKNSNTFEYASRKIKRDEEVILEAVKKNARVFRYIDHDLQNNDELVKKMIKVEENTFEYASSTIRDNKEIILAVVNKNGMLLRWVAPEKQDKEIAMAAIKNDMEAVKYMSDVLKNDLNFMIEILNIIDIKKYNIIESDISYNIKFDNTFIEHLNRISHFIEI